MNTTATSGGGFNQNKNALQKCNKVEKECHESAARKQEGTLESISGNINHIPNSGV